MKTYTKIKKDKQERWFIYFNNKRFYKHLPSNYKKGYKTLAAAKGAATKAYYNDYITGPVYTRLEYIKEFV